MSSDRLQMQILGSVISFSAATAKDVGTGMGLPLAPVQELLDLVNEGYCIKWKARPDPNKEDQAWFYTATPKGIKAYRAWAEEQKSKPAQVSK